MHIRNLAWVFAAVLSLGAVPRVMAQVRDQQADARTAMDPSGSLPDIPEIAGAKTPAEIEEAKDEAQKCYPGDGDRQQLYVSEMLPPEELQECKRRLGREYHPNYAGVGGKIVSIGSVPFQVELRYKASALLPNRDSPTGPFSYVTAEPWEIRHICGGTLIDREWVLTAAHCIDRTSFALGVEVVLSASNIAGDIARQGGFVLPVDRYVLHKTIPERALKPGTTTIPAVPAPPPVWENDIALLHIASAGRNVDWSKVEFAIPETRAMAQRREAQTRGPELLANGWGKNSSRDWRPVAALQQFQLALVPNPDCARIPLYAGQYAPGKPRIHPNVICAGTPPFHLSVQLCKGDSGGPLYYRNNNRTIVVGIVSLNELSCRQRNNVPPGVYTKVGEYERWIAGAKAVLSPSVHRYP